MGWFKKVAKGVLLGTGSILSLINPAIGAPLIVAGSAIQTNTEQSSMDTVSTYGNNLQASLNMAGSMQQAGNLTTITSAILAWIQKNFTLIIILIGAAILLPNLIPRRR